MGCFIDLCCVLSPFTLGCSFASSIIDRGYYCVRWWVLSRLCNQSMSYACCPLRFRPLLNASLSSEYFRRNQPKWNVCVWFIITNGRVSICQDLWFFLSSHRSCLLSITPPDRWTLLSYGVAGRASAPATFPRFLTHTYWYLIVSMPSQSWTSHVHKYIAIVDHWNWAQWDCRVIMLSMMANQWKIHDLPLPTRNVN